MKRLLGLLIAVMMIIAAVPVMAESPEFTIVSPDGAPALVVGALKDHLEMITAENIASAFSGENADFVIAPVNAGAKLYKLGKSNYRLAAVVTWGNLVFASQINEFTPEMINDKKITLFGENTINAVIALHILKEKGIAPAEIEYLGSAKLTQAELLDKPDSIVMTAEPAATAAQFKNDAVTAWALSDLYKEISGQDGFPQAGLFVREQTLNEHPEEVKAWLALIQKSADRCSDENLIAAVCQDAVDMKIMPNEKIALKAIPGCNIRYVSASEARAQLEAIANLDLSQFGGELPSDDFYYAEK